MYLYHSNLEGRDEKGIRFQTFQRNYLLQMFCFPHMVGVGGRHTDVEIRS